MLRARHPIDVRRPTDGRRALGAGVGARLIHALFAGLLVAPVALAVVPALPPELLAVVSLGALVSAGLLALLAWAIRAPAAGPTVTVWDLVGALAFLGSAAGTLSQPEAATPLGARVAP